MHYIFVDEAGNFRGDHFSVVIGVIVEDRELTATRWHLERMFDAQVPSRFRQGFSFHAKDLYNGKIFSNSGWSIRDRSALIAAVAGIPRQLSQAISIGKIRNDAEAHASRTYSEADLRHSMAFHSCITKANQYVRDWSAGDAVVIAEDIPERRRLLAATPQIPVVEFPTATAPRFHHWTKRERKTGVFTQNTKPGQIDRIKDAISFKQKKEEPLLAIADACAFSLRRYLSAQPYGDQLVSMMADGLELEDYQSAHSRLIWSYGYERVYPKLSGPIYRSSTIKPYTALPFLWTVEKF